MTTQAQIQANRRNAQKSTGPQTPSGKAAAAQNALKHGLTSTSLIYGEEKSDYDSFSKAFLEELAPVGPTETHLAERIIALTWRLRRADRLQSAAIDTLTDRSVLSESKQYNCFNNNNVKSQIDNPRGSILGDVAVRDFSNTRILDRLMLYERRIEKSLSKSQQHLRQLQTQRKQKENESEKSISDDSC